jgi:hypothetical protein
MVEAFSLPIFLPLAKKLFTIFFLICHLRHAIILLFFDTTHPNTRHSTAPSRSLLSILFIHLQFCLLIRLEWAINHLLPHDKVRHTHIFYNWLFYYFWNNTSNDMWHSVTPSTSPLSILFSQSLIAVVNSFWTRHQSCFNSLCILTEVRYFTNDYFSFFLTQHLRHYLTACLSIHIAAVHLIQSIIDSGCQ